MNDRITNYIHFHPIRTQRGLEILTGLIPWSIILFPLVGSFFIPEAVAYFIITFNVYWLYRSLQMAVYATSGYLNIKATTKINWLEELAKNSQTKNKYQDILHVILICNYKEITSIVERNLDSLLKQSFPKKNLYIVLALEEREGEAARERSLTLTDKYQDKFGLFISTFHELTPSETGGKHSNETFAAKVIKKKLSDEKGIPIENIIVTSSDADAVFPQEYFSLLTYKFLTDENCFQDFFQAPILLYNNIHRVPLLVRVPSIIGGIYYLSILHKASKRFVNYSTYSTSLKLLDEVGYWDVDVIPEDAHIYFKSYFHFYGKVNVVPLYSPILIDAVESNTKLATLKNSYQQNKRWAWGAVDIPYVIKNFFLHPEISFWDKLIKLSFALEWHFVWSSFWFLLTIGANIPTFFNPAFARTSLGLNLSRISSSILTLGLIGFLVIMIIDALLNPHYKSKVKHFLHPITYLQWLILPITGFFFGSLPGLESQTRLMLGKYLEYRVTEKVTKK